MENKQFPQQEPEERLPEELVPLSPESEAEEVLPVIEELTFAPEAPLPEEIPLVEEIPMLEAFPAEEEAFTVGQLPEEAPMEDTVSEAPSFMDRIPDVEEDYPEEETAEPAPEVSLEPAAYVPAEETPAEEALSIPEPIPSPLPELPSEEGSNPGDLNDTPAPPPEPEPPVRERTTRKGRPKRRKGEGLFGIPNILATFVWLALILAIGVTLGRMLWICAADVLAFGREDREVTITVYEADTMEDIVDKLYDAGLIRYKSLFNLYASISDAEEDIQPGIYDLNTRYDYHALVNFMSPSSTRSVVELTIPEGYTCRQIFSLLEENRVCTALDIAAYAASGELEDYWFLEGVERGSEYCLEGYLFPDTYQFYKNSSPREALEKMLDNFDYRFSEEMRAQIDTLNANVTDGSFTVKDVVIVASLIEKESASASESAKIAGVIYNRLYNWEYPALLNIDAAIIYAQGGESDTIDTSIDSPYNTYLHTGLTPTAIANPGLSSLQAALAPTEHDYYYYLLNPSTGMHQFSTTQAEHDALIAEFYS